MKNIHDEFWFDKLPIPRRRKQSVEGTRRMIQKAREKTGGFGLLSTELINDLEGRYGR